jgi:hypothetical protein
LWQHDPNGNYEMEVMEVLCGYPRLKIGMEAKGSVCSIKNKWVKFDCSAPHAVLPFEGEGMRISIVLFTRQSLLSIARAYAIRRATCLLFGYAIKDTADCMPLTQFMATLLGRPDWTTRIWCEASWLRSAFDSYVYEFSSVDSKGL